MSCLFILSTFVFFSGSRNTVLLLYVLMIMQDRIQWNKRRFFQVSHLVIWSFGLFVILTITLWDENYVYGDDYFNHNICMAKTPFVLVNNGTGCVISRNLTNTMLGFYIVYLLLIINSVVTFSLIMGIAYDSYKKRRSSLLRSPSSIGHTVAKEQSFLFFRATFRYAITSIVYITCFIPLFFVQNYIAFEGPFDHKSSVVYGVFYGLYQPIVALLNVSVYGFFCTAFRLEVRAWFDSILQRLFKNKFRSNHDDALYEPMADVDTELSLLLPNDAEPSH